MFRHWWPVKLIGITLISTDLLQIKVMWVYIVIFPQLLENNICSVQIQGQFRKKVQRGLCFSLQFFFSILYQEQLFHSKIMKHTLNIANGWLCNRPESQAQRYCWLVEQLGLVVMPDLWLEGHRCESQQDLSWHFLVSLSALLRTGLFQERTWAC